MSTAAGSFSCDQSWDSHPNAGPFVTVVDSIKLVVRRQTGNAASAFCGLAVPGQHSTHLAQGALRLC